MSEVFRQEMQDMKTDLHEMQKKVDRLLSAIIGSDLLQDGGIVGRIKLIEKQVNEVELRMIIAEKRNDKLEIYQKILWACGGGVLMGIFTYVLKFIFKV